MMTADVPALLALAVVLVIRFCRSCHRNNRTLYADKALPALLPAPDAFSLSSAAASAAFGGSPVAVSSGAALAVAASEAGAAAAVLAGSGAVPTAAASVACMHAQLGGGATLRHYRLLSADLSLFKVTAVQPLARHIFVASWLQRTGQAFQHARSILNLVKGDFYGQQCLGTHAISYGR